MFTFSFTTFEEKIKINTSINVKKYIHPYFTNNSYTHGFHIFILGVLIKNRFKTEPTFRY
jgi:hypothetical protein